MAKALTESGRRGSELAYEAVDLLELAHARNELPMALTVLSRQLDQEPSDRLGSQRLLRRAVEVAGECDNVYWKNEAEGLLRGATEPGELTAQEAKVAKLANAGYKNGEIAVRLSLTRRTIEFHLSAVYRKLGISSRHELARCL
jgi:DNA-binding NarL/FixJ family response regulator